MKKQDFFKLLSAILLAICFGAFNSQEILANENSSVNVASNSTILSVTLSKNEVVGGTNLEGTITLISASALGGNVIPLASDNHAVTVPASVTVPLGATRANFTITTNSVEKDINVTIKAGQPNAQKTVTLLVKPLTINSLRLSSNQVVGETKVQCRISLNAPASAGGFNVSLSSNNSTVASVPTQITVPAGQAFAVFDITTSRVTTDTSVTVSATDKLGGKASATLNVTLPLIPEILSMTSNSFATGASQYSINFVFDRPLPLSHPIQLSSSNSSVISVPPNLQISTGLANFQFFVTPTQVVSETPITITAVSGNSTKSVTFTVRPLLLETFTLPASNITGGSSMTATLALNLPRSTNTTITLTKSDSSISMPLAISLPARTDFSNPATVTFDIFTPTVTSLRSVTITATLPADLGGGTRTAAFTISPVTLNTISLDTPRCDLNRNCPSIINGTVTLNGPAPPGGVVVGLNSNQPSAATVTPTILIPSGQTTSSFTVSIQSGIPSAIIRITATAGSGSSIHTNLELEKTFLEVESISLNTTQVQGGTPVTGTVTVRQFVVLESNQTTVTPTTSNVIVSLSRNPSIYSGNIATGTFQPTFLNIPSGQSSEQFTITPAAVNTPTTIQIQAVANSQLMGSLASGSVRSVGLTVNPATIQSLNLSQTEVQGGQQVTGTIQMNGLIPSFGNSVSITSSEPTIASIGSSQFNLQTNILTFSVNTSASVTSTTTVTITASFAGQTMTAQLTVNRPSQLSAVSFPSNRLIGRQITNLRVELDGPAPSGGALITFNSSNEQVLQLFGSQVTIPAGQNFGILSVTPDKPPNPTSVTARAFYGQQTNTTLVTVEPLRIDFCEGIANIVGGQQINCVLRITNDGLVAPEGGYEFNVTSGNSSVLSAPPIITIPAGQNSVSFQVTTQIVTQNSPIQLQISNNLTSFGRNFTVMPL